MSRHWKLDSLLKRNLWIVTGKGGVGKTTVTAALGLLAAGQGLKTLLVETHGLSHLAELFEVEASTDKPRVFRRGLSLFQVNAEAAFQEYVLRQIKFEFIYNAVFNNKYVRHFIDAAPGLAELLVIGKIWALVEDEAKRGKKRPYDLVIVDAPSTGHSLSLLTVPQVVADAVRVGPLKGKAEEILALLRDREKTLTWLVTLSEEMPVNEAVEMEEKLRKEAKIAVGPVLLNSVWPEIFSQASWMELRKKAIDQPILKLHTSRVEQRRYYAERLRERLANPQILELPLIYQSKSPYQIADRLSELIREQLVNVL